jgi:DNA-binding response OmpR family regulator
MSDKSILINEDDPVSSALMKLNVEKRGHKVLCSSDGTDALKMLNLNKVDLLISDVVIPNGMDGFSLLKSVKKDSRLSKIPVFIVTARKNMQETFNLMGVDYFFTKPLDIEQFLCEIDNILTMKVILFGDEVKTVESMKKNLTKFHFLVEETNKIDEFLKAFDTFKYRMIILQSKVFTVTADSLIEKIRASKRNANTPIVIYARTKTSASPTTPALSEDELLLIRQIEKNCEHTPHCVIMDKGYSLPDFLKIAERFLQLE